MSVVTVVSVDASEAEKAQADYVCDGIDDHVEIQRALDDAALREEGPS